MHSVICHTFLYFGLPEKTFSEFIFLIHGNKIWPTLDKYLFVYKDFKGQLDE